MTVALPFSLTFEKVVLTAVSLLCLVGCIQMVLLYPSENLARRINDQIAIVRQR